MQLRSWIGFMAFWDRSVVSKTSTSNFLISAPSKACGNCTSGLLLWWRFILRSLHYLPYVRSLVFTVVSERSVSHFRLCIPHKIAPTRIDPYIWPEFGSIVAYIIGRPELQLRDDLLNLQTDSIKRTLLTVHPGCQHTSVSWNRTGSIMLALLFQRQFHSTIICKNLSARIWETGFHGSLIFILFGLFCFIGSTILSEHNCGWWRREPDPKLSQNKREAASFMFRLPAWPTSSVPAMIMILKYNVNGYRRSISSRCPIIENWKSVQYKIVTILDLGLFINRTPQHNFSHFFWNPILIFQLYF